MSHRFWKVTGKDLKEQSEDWLSRYQGACQSLLRFSRRVGGSRTRFGAGWGFGSLCVSVSFNTPPDPKLWRHRKNDDPKLWIPRRSGPGLKLAKELDAIERSFPTRNELADMIGMEVWAGRYFRNAGVHRGKNGEVFISTPDDFDGCKGLRRVSDVTFERAAA